MFILRGHAGFDLANLLSLGSKALAAMTSLLVRLNTWPCPNGHEILDHRRTRCMKCNNEVAADPICNSYGLKLRTKGNFLKQWEQACSHLASGISLGQLHLTFICDVEDLAAGDKHIEPLTNLPKLKTNTIRLGRLRNRDLASLAERTSQKMTSTFIPGSGFPFELLPEEIRLRVLQFTHIGPNGPYHDRYEDLFVESGKLIKSTALCCSACTGTYRDCCCMNLHSSYSKSCLCRRLPKELLSVSRQIRRETLEVLFA